MLVIPACGIPQLCCPQPGPVMPEMYSDVYNSPNQPSDPTVEPVQQVSTSESDDATTFASFIEAADTQELNEVPASPVSEVDQAVSTESSADSAYEELLEFEDDGVVDFDDEVVSWENSARVSWWEFFNDPNLSGLINQAFAGNQELKILAQEIRKACLEVQARQGEYLPFVTAGMGAGLEKSSRFTREGAVEDQLTAAPGRGFPEPLPDFLLGASVTWEIDIWKRLRNAKNAAAYRYLATREGRTFVMTRLVAEVAENYYELLALDNRLQTIDKTIEIQQQSLKIAEAKKEAGRGTELAVQRFVAEVSKNESEKLIIQQEIIEVENRINFLLGRYPQPVERHAEDYVNLSMHALSVGVPSQLLRNRADIRQAERELAAAGLDVKSARARFYPSLALTAGVGYQAFNTKYLFSSPESLIYNVAGDLVAPLINKKAIRADYLSANATQLQKVYDYQRTVLNAFTEVINLMAKVDNYGKSIEIKKQQLASLESSVDNATKLFQNARAEYMEVLLAQRDLMEAKLVLIETKQEQLSAVVNAYQALGGGQF
ncbi:efflux transporter outer membrane subunit [Stieleria sp. JC731]|uniref:TolC family protein n=1 Tax=Pirellulaceae TaxID=2691357 RepID=UPI001E5D32F1|nr:efflux transporter outer membrane subunit [Stieleria sp. JC731]MCC9602406.1 efflux transporter outer membrane subunit [Stieleria sp. JC731]